MGIFWEWGSWSGQRMIDWRKTWSIWWPWRFPTQQSLRYQTRFEVLGVEVFASTLVGQSSQVQRRAPLWSNHRLPPEWTVGLHHLSFRSCLEKHQKWWRQECLALLAWALHFDLVDRLFWNSVGCALSLAQRTPRQGAGPGCSYATESVIIWARFPTSFGLVP